MSEPTGIEKMDEWLNDPRLPPHVREAWIKFMEDMSLRMYEIMIKSAGIEPVEGEKK